MQPEQAHARSSRIFFYLATLTVLLTIGLIVFGAIVRVTDSGLGCGEEWPLCNGTIFPPLDNVTAWIEWSHRLFASLIGILGLGMLVVAWRRYFHTHRVVFIVTTIAALLYLTQSALGALTVVLGLSPTMVTLHLGTAMLLLGALLIAGLLTRYQPEAQATQDHVTTLTYITALLAFVIILTGALVRGSGATLACTDWPLCFGQILPTQQGQLAVVHMLHRLAVAVLGIALLLLVWQVYITRSQRAVRYAAVGALLAYLLQAAVGALFVFTSAAPIWGAAHVGFAAITWAFLVALVFFETLNSRHSQGALWIPQSDMKSA